MITGFSLGFLRIHEKYLQVLHINDQATTSDTSDK